jgi:hypothetical protein
LARGGGAAALLFLLGAALGALRCLVAALAFFFPVLSARVFDFSPLRARESQSFFL